LGSSEEVLQRWTEHFREILKADVDLTDPSSLPDVLPSDPESASLTPEQAALLQVPSLEEVSLAINKMGLGKSPGHDGISSELLRLPVCIQWLHRIILGVWQVGIPPKEWMNAVAIPLYKGKGGASECDNYRGIMLLSVPGKVYARILASRLSIFAECCLSENQNGFRSGRSCMDTIFVLRRLMELSRDQQQQLLIAFIDFSKAYDSVLRGKLWDILKGYGIPDSFIFRVAGLHLSTAVQVRVGGVLGEEFLTRLGLRQGCVLAPVLFNLYLDAVMRKTPPITGVPVEVVPNSQLIVPNSSRLHASYAVVVKEIRFADDIALFGQSQAELQNSLASLHRTCTPYNLNISTKKTKVMAVGLDISQLQPCTVGDSKVDFVDSFTYLGSDVFSDCNVHKEVFRRIGMALSSFSSMKSSLWKRREISVKTKLRIFNAIVLSRLLYGAETWALTEYDVHGLESFYLYCLRRILRISWMDRVGNEEVRNRCELPTFEAILRQRRLRWLGHVDRMADDRLPKALLWGRLLHSKRKQGGPKKRWTDVCSQDLHALNMHLDWRSICQNRSEWAFRIKATDRVTRRELSRIKRKQSDQGGNGIVLASDVSVPSSGFLGTASHDPQHLSGPLLIASAVGPPSDTRVPNVPSNPVHFPQQQPQVRTTRRANVADRAIMTVVCDTCLRRFARESDRKRHRCSTTRKKT